MSSLTALEAHDLVDGLALSWIVVCRLLRALRSLVARLLADVADQVHINRLWLLRSQLLFDAYKYKVRIKDDQRGEATKRITALIIRLAKVDLRGVPLGMTKLTIRTVRTKSEIVIVAQNLMGMLIPTTFA